MIPEATVDVGQTLGKEMTTIMIIEIAQGVIAPHGIVVIVPKVAKVANMVRRNQVNVIVTVAVGGEIVIETTIVIIVNHQGVKAHHVVEMKRKNKMNQRDIYRRCAMMIETANMVANVENLMLVNITYHQFPVLKTFILQ